ncbi:MAG TPA: DUF3445 domain-containing protein [Devosia sp.]|nr:DUF3445 domain-containing protein [Devosia sp.]
MLTRAMTVPRHTPYDGSSKLFEIGLKPLEPDDWVDVDGRLAADLEEKERLLAATPEEVFAAEPGTWAGQQEALALLAAHLPARFPQIYRHLGEAIEIVPAGRRIDLAATPALVTAARLIQEDLVLMHRGESGWRLAAGCVCFPSSWRVSEKFGRPVDEIHGPVPGFGPGTRPAELISRMFDNLQPSRLVIRWNWSLYGDASLAHPVPPPAPRFGTGRSAEHVFLRTERQTMRKLPQSRDILFAIKIAVEPLEALEQHPDRVRIAAALIGQIEALSPAQLEYKGMTADKDRLLVRLRDLAAA